MSSAFPTALVALVIAHSSLAELPKLTPPPVASKGDVVEIYHGTKIADPYRAMEDLKDPKVLEWMKAQSAYATAVLNQIPGRKELLKRIQELDKGAPYTVSDLSRLQDGTIFYQKLSAGAETRVICSRKSVTGEEMLVLNPKVYETAGGSHASLEFFMPSPDGRFGIAGISKGGSEVTTIFARDLAAGKDLPVTIDRIETAYNVPQWLPDSSGFIYSRRQDLPEGTPASEKYKNTMSRLHKLGRPVEEDVPVFGFKLSPKIDFAPLDFPSVRVFPNSDYVIGQIHHGDSQELTLYTARRDQLGEKTVPWKKVCGVPDGVVAFEIHGDFVYLVTSMGAPRYKIVRVPLAEPDFAKAEVVLPESELVLTSVSASKGAVFVNATLNGSGVVVQVDPDGTKKPKQLEPPQNLTGEVAEASPFFPEIFVSTESWTKGGALYTYSPANGEFVESALQPKGAFDDVPGYTSKEVEVKSHDGAMVPLSIIYKEGLKLDGSHPLMLNGYGAYGSIRRAGFSPMNLAWLERGGIVAVAHVRGGGEKGKDWHTGGQKETKPNTWKDLIACAEY